MCSADFPDEEAETYRHCELPKAGAELEPRPPDILGQCSVSTSSFSF